MEQGAVEVSVVVPAHDAERWAVRLVHTLRQQRFTGWEAIVVDDGSTDDTARAFTDAFGNDTRFRLVRQGAAGVSAARNAGIAAAQHDWLLFLDTDDRIDPFMLQRLTERVRANPQLELVHCGWAWETSAGDTAPEHDTELQSGADLFQISTYRCPTLIHAALVRKAVVDEVGRFDTDLLVAEDWDLWQRVGRRGVVSAFVPDVLAFYRLTPGSAMRRDFVRTCADSRRVVERGHAPDQRVRMPRPDVAAGAAPDDLGRHLDHVVLWTAAAAAGVGAPVSDVLAAFPAQSSPPPDLAAAAVFGSLPTATGVLHRDWPELWPGVAAEVGQATDAIASWLGRPASAGEIRRGIEARIAAYTPVPPGGVVGATQVIDADVRTVSALPPMPGVEQVVLRVVLGDRFVGPVIVTLGPLGAGRDAVRRAVTRTVARPILAAVVRRPRAAPAVVRALGPRHSASLLGRGVRATVAGLWRRARRRVGSAARTPGVTAG